MCCHNPSHGAKLEFVCGSLGERLRSWDSLGTFNHLPQPINPDAVTLTERLIIAAGGFQYARQTR